MSQRHDFQLGHVLTVFEFELRRALTAPRIAWWCVLAFFPVAMTSLILLVPNARQNIPVEVWSSFLFALIPMLISMLGTFLWTAPAVSAELERQSWVYLAVRPFGRTSVLLGKYMAAIAWVLPATIIGVSLSVLIIRLAGGALQTPGATFRVWFAILRLSCLSVPAYAAIYLMLGTLFTQRAMVVSVAYTLIFELVVGFVPALINKLTIQYRLRALFLAWADIDVSAAELVGPMDLFSQAPAWQHVTILLTYIVIMVAAALALVRRREYVLASSAG